MVSDLVISEIIKVAKIQRSSINRLFDKFGVREKLEVVKPIDEDVETARATVKGQTHFSDHLPLGIEP